MVLTTFSLIAAFMLSMLSILSLAELPELITCETSDQLKIPIIKLKAALPIQRNRFLLIRMAQKIHFKIWSWLTGWKISTRRFKFQREFNERNNKMHDRSKYTNNNNCHYWVGSVNFTAGYFNNRDYNRHTDQTMEKIQG